MDRPEKLAFSDESYFPLARGDTLAGLAFLAFSFGIVLATTDATLADLVLPLAATVNFTLGIPLFCSGLAILINNNVRVSAIYDPFHHIVYTGVLQGLDEHAPEQIAEAQKLHVASGNWIPLREAAEQTRQRNRRKQVIGIHLTRSHDDKLAEFLGTNGPEDWSQLGALAREFGGIYALNSGILAMTEVARGAFGGFVNNITNPWDVAPGEVLVKACGGKVTDFQGHPIDYATKGRRTSVVAGYNAEFHQDIVDTLGKHSH